MDKVYARRTLEAAWKRVAANRGAAGVDGVSVERFKAREGHYLEELQVALKEGRYRPEPVRRVHIPKGSGETRPLGIPTVKDRIVQTALKMVLEPIFEREFLPVSYGFRPGRGCKDALREVDALLKAGYTFVVDANVKSYFDTLPQGSLMDRLEDKISDGKVLALVEAFLGQKAEGVRLSALDGPACTRDCRAAQGRGDRMESSTRTFARLRARWGGHSRAALQVGLPVPAGLWTGRRSGRARRGGARKRASSRTDSRASSAAMRTSVTGVLGDSRRDSSAIRRAGISTTPPASALIGPSVERSNPGIPSAWRS